MAIAVEVTFHGQDATLAKYFESVKLMGAQPGGPHPDPACMFHWITEIGGGLAVTDVWQTKEAFETFAATKIGPMGEKVGLPKPQIKFIDVANFFTAGS
jgi:hypothetical protein